MLQNLEVNVNYKQNDSFIILDEKSLINLNQSVLNAFESDHCNLLIVESNVSKTMGEDLRILCKKLVKILKKLNHKKLVLISKPDDKLSETICDETKVEIGANKICEESLETIITLKDLSNDSQKLISENMIVNFQGNRLCLESFRNQKLSEFIDQDILLSFINNIDINIGSKLPSLEEVENYYIQRNFNRSVNLKKSIVTNSNRFYVVKSDFHEIYDSDDILMIDVDKDIILLTEDNSKLSIVCNNYKMHNIHWIKESRGNLCWQKSFGKVSKLHEYIDTKVKQQSKAKNLRNLDEKINLVSAEPGMGKSTVLTQMALQTKNLDQQSWIVRVNLNDHTNELKNLSLDCKTLDKVLEFLNRVMNLKSNFEKKILELMISECGGIMFLFDGFDEITPFYKEKVLTILKILKDTKVEIIWVTTRPHVKTALEDHLSTLSLTLEPMSREDQVEFLRKYWSNNLKVNIEESDERLNGYSKALLNVMKNSISDAEEKFTGIPLQLQLLAARFQSDFKEFIGSDSCEHNLPEMIDLIDLYKFFIDEKLTIYSKQKKKSDMTNCSVISDEQDIKRKSLKRHQMASIALLARDQPLFCKIEKGYKKIVEQFTEGNIRTGIINQIIDGKPEFVHRTFAEYLFALWLSDNLKDEDVKLYLQINLFKEENAVVRHFFDLILASDSYLHKVLLVKRYHLLTDELKSLFYKGSDVTDKQGRSLLHLAVSYDDKEDYVEVLVNSNMQVTKHDDIFGWTPLRYADQFHNWFAVDKMLAQKNIDKADLVELSKEIATYSMFHRKTTLLHVAAERNFLNLAAFLLKKGVSQNFVMKHCKHHFILMWLFVPN